MIRPSRFVLTNILIIFFIGFLPAHTQTDSKVTLQRIDVTQLPEIQVDFIVSDADGECILGLSESEILIRIDGVEQTIGSLLSAFEGGEYLAVALLFDRSGSMKEALDLTKTAAMNFVDRMSSQDEVAVISFDDKVSLDSAFSKDRDTIRAAVNSIEPGRNTALYDAVDRALDEFEKTATKRKAIVILSDGKDTRSRLSREVVLGRAKTMGVPLFAIGIGSIPDDAGLKSLAGETGGSEFLAAEPSDLLSLYQRIAEQLNNQYRASFVSSFGEDDQWRRLSIEVHFAEEETILREREFLASRGMGVSRGALQSVQDDISRRDLGFGVGIGAAAGLLFGIFLLGLIRIRRVDFRLFSLAALGLLISCLILGSIVGAFLGF